MNSGWIKLHRKLLDNPMCNKPAWAWLWITLLLLANHDDDHKFIWDFKEITLKKGQFVTGRKVLSNQTGIPETTIERILDYLQNSGQIGQQKTTKYRLITIVKWNEYQEVDNKRTTNGQQTDTFKNVRSKEYKNKNKTSDVPSQEVVELIESFKEVNPMYSKWFANSTQRSACERLIKINGLDKIKRIVSFLPKSNATQYMPVVTTPLQLEDKFGQLASSWQKLKNNKTVIL
jgi:hypothetical protein